MKSRIVAAALAVVSGAANAQGYFDFSQVPGLGDEPTVQIDLNPAMLGFLRTAAEASDPNAAAALAGIQNVRVRVYETLEDSGAVLAFVEDSSGRLESDGWQRVVYVQDEASKVRIYVKLENERAVGMTVMVVEGGGGEVENAGEAVFINIAGDINPATLGQLASSMGMGGVLDGMIGTVPAAE